MIDFRDFASLSIFKKRRINIDRIRVVEKNLPFRAETFQLPGSQAASVICIRWTEQTRNGPLSKWSEPLFTLDRPRRFCCKRCKNPFVQVKPQQFHICMDDATRHDENEACSRGFSLRLSLQYAENSRRFCTDKHRERKRERENLKERSKNGRRLYVALWPSSSFIIPLPVNRLPMEAVYSRGNCAKETCPSRRDVISQLSRFYFSTASATGIISETKGRRTLVITTGSNRSRFKARFHEIVIP